VVYRDKQQDRRTKKAGLARIQLSKDMLTTIDIVSGVLSFGGRFVIVPVTGIISGRQLANMESKSCPRTGAWLAFIPTGAHTAVVVQGCDASTDCGSGRIWIEAALDLSDKSRLGHKGIVETKALL
jgi:hypothetical protein